MVTVLLCNKDTQPSQTCSEGHTFPATVTYRGVSLYLGGINYTICSMAGLICNIHTLMLKAHNPGLYHFKQWPRAQGIPQEHVPDAKILEICH